MKKFMTYCLCAVTMALCLSCGSDDPEMSPNDPGKVQAGSKLPNGLVCTQWGGSNIQYNIDGTIKNQTLRNYGVAHYSYNPLVVTVKNEYGIMEKYYDFTFNSAGLITSFKCDWYEDGVKEETGVHNFQYVNGCLSQYEFIEEYYYGDGDYWLYSRNVQLVWSNGSVVQINRVTEEVDGEWGGVGSGTYYFTSGGTQNRFNQPTLDVMCCALDMCPFEPYNSLCALAMNGKFGKFSKYFPVIVRDEGEYKGNTYIDMWQYEYEFNSNGLVSEFCEDYDRFVAVSCSYANLAK